MLPHFNNLPFIPFMCLDEFGFKRLDEFTYSKSHFRITFKEYGTSSNSNVEKFFYIKIYFLSDDSDPNSSAIIYDDVMLPTKEEAIQLFRPYKISIISEKI